MPFIISDTSYALTQASIDTANGQITDLGPLVVTGLAVEDVIIGAAYDPALPGWRLLIAHPE